MGSNIRLFRKPRHACEGCGITLVSGNVCPKCKAWDLLLRSMHLRQQALSMLAGEL